MDFIGKVARWALTRRHDRRGAMRRPDAAGERPSARRPWAGLALIALALALSGPAAPQTAGRRVALVIGNDDYQHIDKLQKAKADATAYAAVLRGKGFSVQEGYDLSMLEMSSAVADFVQKINPGDTAVFVYSGHGWSDGAHNYLVGVDVPGRATEELLTRLSLPLRNGVDGVLDDLERKNAGLKAAIIDACRDSPFRPPPGERGYALARGLKPQSVEGSFIIYSAGEGQSAMDRLSDADSIPTAFSPAHSCRCSAPTCRCATRSRPARPRRTHWRPPPTMIRPRPTMTRCWARPVSRPRARRGRGH